MKYTQANINEIQDVKLISGYAVSRNENKETNIKLVKMLVENYALDFIKHIKGHFIIQLKDEKCNIHLYTDHIGIKKLFYWQNGKNFIISDSIDDIVKEVKPKLSSTNLALHSLFHHFVDGRTMYEGVFYSKPASHFVISSQGELSIEQYWGYDELLKLPEKKYDYKDFATVLNKITKSYLALSEGGNVTMTLTGGMDSRIVLGALLANDVKPYAFTFGNENSADVECSTEIAKAFGLDYNNYNYPHSTADWYKALSEEIVRKGNSLVHIHRSHRLDALKREKQQHPDVDTIFLGAMGGEGIRGLHYDDLITTPFVRRYYENDEDVESLVKEYLPLYFYRIDDVDVSEVINIINDLPYIKNSYKNNQFFLLYELVASLHDTQDITLYYSSYKNVITPFLDIDYLEMLFSSDYHLLRKEGTSHKIKDRLVIPKFHCNVSHCIYSDLDRFQYSNGFSPKEYLLGKYPYLFIRGVRRYFKKKYPPNFPYDSWFYPFVVDHLMDDFDERLNLLFDIERAKRMVKNEEHSFKEGYWHKMTNLIMYNMMLKK